MTTIKPVKIKQFEMKSKGGGLISCIDSESAWTCDKSGSVMLVDTLGNEKEKLKSLYTTTGILTVTKEGNALFIDPQKNIMEVGKDMVTRILIDGHYFSYHAKSFSKEKIYPHMDFDEIEEARSLVEWMLRCVHSSHVIGDVFVGMKVHDNEGIIMRFDSQGKYKADIKICQDGELRCKDPWFLTHNVNGDICVSDAFTAVVVSDMSGKFRFSYKGQPSQKSFWPRGICTDTKGNILVCDDKNGSVHMIDCDGNFLKILLSEEDHGIEKPWSICFDDNKNLWCGSQNSNAISIYKYTGS